MTQRLGRVSVIGLGASGRAVARYLADRLGTEVDAAAAFDAGDSAALREAAAELESLGVAVTIGEPHGHGTWDLCVASPGIPPHTPLFKWAAGASTRLVSEIEFAFERSASPWLAVTGTNGKTTTTSLLAHLLLAAGIPASPVGNIGIPAISAIEQATPGTALVAEVSSFQLAATDRFRPRVAVLLNITPDHIDWHGSMERYASDKARVFANMGADDTAVIDVDDPGSAPWADALAERGVRVARVTRGSLPEGGAGLAGDELALHADGVAVPLVRVDELQIRGAHNVSNALAASAAAHAFGARASDIARGLRTFRPIEHRLEPVGIVDGVEYVNDSKATNPDAVLKALTAFEGRPLVVLLGGRNKGSDFTELARRVCESATAAVLFGEAAGELRAAFEAQGGQLCELRSVRTLPEALQTGRDLAEPGGAVLLSPACASFDQFADYTERGRAFKQLVSAMQGRGEA